MWILVFMDWYRGVLNSWME